MPGQGEAEEPVSRGNIQNAQRLLAVAADQIDQQFGRELHQRPHGPSERNPNWIVVRHRPFLRDRRSAAAHRFGELMETRLELRRQQELQRPAQVRRRGRARKTWASGVSA